MLSVLTGDVGDVGDGKVQTDFGFSFDAAPTIDTVLYFRVEMKEDGGRRS